MSDKAGLLQGYSTWLCYKLFINIHLILRIVKEVKEFLRNFRYHHLYFIQLKSFNDMILTISDLSINLS